MDNQNKLVGQHEEIPLHELLDSRTVNVIVGEEKIRWPLPQRLLAYHSPVFASAFNSATTDETDNESSSDTHEKSSSKVFPLLDEENKTFELLVAYFYSHDIPTLSSEASTGPLLDLYLLAQKLQISHLAADVVDSVRDWYHSSSTYPGLRRVQYIYANTDEDNDMREMMISAVARQLATGEAIPAHWASALKRNGQLALDILRAIQQWHIEEKSIPDARDARGRRAKGGFSAVGREGDSMETDASGLADSAIGLESHDGDMPDEVKENIGPASGHAESNMTGLREVAATAEKLQRDAQVQPHLSSHSQSHTPMSLLSGAQQSSEPGGTDDQEQPSEKRSHEETIGLLADTTGHLSVNHLVTKDTRSKDNCSRTIGDSSPMNSTTTKDKREAAFLVALWTVYLSYLLGLPHIGFRSFAQE